MVHRTLGHILNATREAAAVGRGARAHHRALIGRCFRSRNVTRSRPDSSDALSVQDVVGLASVVPRSAAATPIENMTPPRGALPPARFLADSYAAAFLE